jgi:hypothetical protein
VKKRKVIWDSSSEEYKNRNPRKSQWIEVCTVFYPVQMVQINHMRVFSVGVPAAKRGRT